MNILYKFFEQSGFVVDKNNLNFNQRNQDGDTPLIVAVRLDNLEIVMLLIKYGQDKLEINSVRTSDGYTAFMLAVRQRSLDIVLELLDMKKLNINQQNYLGETALYIAAKEGFAGIVTEILSSKLHIILDRVAKNNKTALDIASEKKFFSIVQDIDKSDIKTSSESEKITEVSDPVPKILPCLDPFMTNPVVVKKSEKTSKEDNETISINVKKNLVSFIFSEKKPDKIEFENYKKRFEQWAFSVNAEQKSIREDHLCNDTLVPLTSGEVEQTRTLFSKLKILWKDLIIEYHKNHNLIRCSMIMKNISQSLNANYNTKKPKENLEILSELDDTLKDHCVQNLIAMQVIMEVCSEQIELLEPKVPKNHSIIKELNDFIKECETDQLQMVKFLQEEFVKNAILQSKQDQIIFYIDALTLELNEHKKEYSDWITEGNIKRKEASLEKVGCQNYTMYLLKQMRFGLSPRQHAHLIIEIGKNIKALNDLRKNAQSESAESPSSPVIFKNQNYCTKRWQELTVVWSRQANFVYSKNLFELFTYQKQAVEQQLQFFLEQSKFIHSYYPEFKWDLKIALNLTYFQKCSFTFSLGSLFPKGLLSNQFCKISQSKQAEVENQLDSLCFKIETCNEEIQYLEKEILQQTATIKNQEKKIMSCESELKKLLDHKNSIQKRLGISQSKPDDFSPLYLANDLYVDNLKFKIEDINFQIEMAEEDESFSEVPLSQLRFNKRYFTKQLNQAIQEYNSIQQEVIQVEKNYFSTSEQLESLREDRNFTQGELNETYKRKNEQEHLKYKSEEELEVQNNVYFHLCLINQRIYSRKMILNDDLDDEEYENQENEGDVEDESNSQKLKVQAMIEDICMAITGCVVDAFEDTYNTHSISQSSKSEIFSRRIQDIEAFFVKQAHDCLSKAQYDKQYIKAKIIEIEKQCDLFKNSGSSNFCVDLVI